MLRTCGLVIAVALLLGACGDGGGGNTVEAMAAPSDLQYGLGTGEVGSPFGPYPPTVSGTVTGYSVSPAMPAGLTLDPSSGVISGTPLARSSGTYTVTARNAAGAATAALTLVVLVAPIALTYTSPVTATVGAPLTPLVPTFSGDADAFEIWPALPNGLMFDKTTGIVSGTPTSARLVLTYTVTASNASNTVDSFTRSQFLLTVDPPPAGTSVTGVFRSDTVIGLGYVSGTHSGLTDKNGAFTYEEGQSITFAVGRVTIGAIPTAKTLVTPVDLVAHGNSASNRVLNVVRFLMMLDQDGNINNGIQISAAVTAAAANWIPVDFDTTDLPTTVGPIIEQASAADGVSHVLPDAATAQAHLRTGFYCTHSGDYYGTFGRSTGTRGDFVASISPDGSMNSKGGATDTLSGFAVLTYDAVSPSLDGTFAQGRPSVALQGSFADATYLSGTYALHRVTEGGDFQAVRDASDIATYIFTGSFTKTPNDSTMNPDSGSVTLRMDDSNQVSGSAWGRIAGSVSGSTFTGTASYMLDPYTAIEVPVSGTYSNTASGATLDGQYSDANSVVTFSTVGCRAN
jgi:Putative Ig domain